MPSTTTVIAALGLGLAAFGGGAAPIVAQEQPIYGSRLMAGADRVP
jgi:hypothetical protein